MNLGAPVQQLDNLAKCDRDKDTEDDDSDLSGEPAPSVNWFRQMEAHVSQA
jgi:hypothetical protein